MALGLSGFGGELVQYQPMMRWRKTSTSRDVRASIAVLQGPGGFLQGELQSLPRPEHSSSSPKFSALRSALC
jgi:hypothetical protein